MRPGADVAIDIGGTWFRVREAGQVTRRMRTPSRLNHPAAPAPELFRRLVALILDHAPRTGRVAISLGAATDDVAKRLIGSGPLWGDWRPVEDIQTVLESARSDLSWFIFNDVSCALADFSTTVDPALTSHVGFLTVSSGIALRIADLDNRIIPVDEAGMQGEVGHLPLPVTSSTDLTTGLRCECGGRGHLASVASGPGIRRVSERLGMDAFSIEWFIGALDRQDERAHAILDAATEPIAELIRALWTTQPWIGVLGVGGGVPESIPVHYRNALRTHLAAATGYTALSAAIWTSGLRVLSAQDHISNLRGAQLLAQGHLTITRAKAQEYGT